MEMICRNTQFCKRMDIGINNKMFGALLMMELDSTTATFVAEILENGNVVTKNMCVEFVSPIIENDIYKTYIGLKKIGNTSITLEVEIRKHTVDNITENIAVKCEAVFVQVDANTKPKIISNDIRTKHGFENITK
jgi:acyl-CoA hydrolase